MDTLTKLTIPIEPKPQTRPKFSKFGTYEDPKMKAWRKSCAYLVKSLWQGEKLEGPLKVSVTFYMKAPQSIGKKPTPRAKPKTWEKFKRFVAELMWHSKKPDIDNLIKAVFDSISDAKCVWNDDNQVSMIVARKLYSPNPRIEFLITQLEEVSELEYGSD